ncbi:MAG: helix-turn-helix transcriptional regulator [Inconstantimicrobium porci]|uniref:helix-turn-helix domain-containing protein n=1 Tax=Inconstantimicrobium porci TaxID=2652291 RepID=UPI002A90BA48|nr:helix-turn-helix transcriptional regulator [Inconstantimicrobium porci]MDY5912429.1 helix-turn-helix transcriptional regulator [Inconstantimicrobium porci]
MKTTGQKILMLREEKQLKQSELAETIGVTEATLSRYENDKRKPRGEIALKIAKALNVSIDYLLDDNITDRFSTISNPENQNTSLTQKEILDIEKDALEMIEAIDNSESLKFCGTTADEEDKEYLKQAYQKFLMDVRVYNKQKYTPNKYK